jgi:hypothetical protein
MLSYHQPPPYDLQKAFDCVKHIILIDKLEFYGLEGKFKTLIKSYLTDRHQRVELSDKSNRGGISNWERIECGVPQGSILGPILFTLYKRFTKDIKQR